MVDIHLHLDRRDLRVVFCLLVCFLNKTLISIIVTARVKKITFGSVSAGREKRPFNVLFFLKVEPPCDQT